MIRQPRRDNVYLTVFTVTRLVVSTALRLLYPFLPAIARGLGVSLEAVALLVTLRSALGLAGPALGTVADHWGRRVGMLFGLALFSGGLFLVVFWSTYPGLAVGLVLSGVGNIIVDSTIYAFIGDRFPYERRARAIGLVEMGWSGAFVIGMPLVGWLIARKGWDAPFLWLALSGVVLLLALGRLLPRDAGDRSDRVQPMDGIRLVLRQRVVWAGLLFGLLMVAANQVVSIIYGAWMEIEHGLRVQELGAASTVLGIAGIAGVLLVALLADRLGKRRAISLGIAVNVLAVLALPWLGKSLPGALASLFLFYLSFEFSLTSALPLMTELVPAARATMMAANVAAIAAGDAVGAYLGARLFELGITANSTAAALLNVAGLVMLLLFVRVGVPVQQEIERSAV